MRIMASSPDGKSLLAGAGDVFHGAFIYGLLQEWQIEKIAKFSNAVAAMKCRKLGGRAGIPTLEEAMDFLKARSR